ncbi:MAG: aldo/keto reductase [Eubacteriales bacterium]|nr:aldo/keto reductase [Eubacteriales bacterium]
MFIVIAISFSFPKVQKSIDFELPELAMMIVPQENFLLKCDNKNKWGIDMNKITLNNNIQMPMLGFGTFLMNGAQCEESVLAALRSGYRMIDTAEAYGNEDAVGNAIMKSGIPREELFLITKVNFRSYENACETVETSLKKLKTSYLDARVIIGTS